MKLNAVLRRKDAAIETQTCTVEDILELRRSEYASLQ